MARINIIKLSKIFRLGNTIGLKNEEISDIINTPRNRNTLDLEISPSKNLADTYGCGGHYGTISIKYFHIR